MEHGIRDADCDLADVAHPEPGLWRAERRKSGAAQPVGRLVRNRFRLASVRRCLHLWKLRYRVLAARTDLLRVLAQTHHGLATLLVTAQRLAVLGAGLSDSLARSLHF